MLATKNDRINDLTLAFYKEALRKAWWRRLGGRMLGRCTDLLSSGEVLESVAGQPRHFVGTKMVQLDQIVGSAGRYSAFDLSFLPRHDATRERWLSVAQGALSGTKLPPVQLLQVGSVYFVEDGHHRISVAQAMDKDAILARVTELSASGLRPDSSCTRFGFSKRDTSKDC